MRELDDLLLRYLENRYPHAPEDEKLAFQRILELPDPELNSYFLQKKKPKIASTALIIEFILNLKTT
tara:strand:+ start:237 stop:437 length:201 start_codon:yes stop_codon:yes gene_type:complete